MKYISLCSGIFITLSGCANQAPCEDITLASEQYQACQQLEKQISALKNKPLMRSELQRRYQQNCLDFRYYRNEHQRKNCREN